MQDKPRIIRANTPNTVPTFIPNIPVRTEDRPHMEQRPLITRTSEPTIQSTPSISVQARAAMQRDYVITCRNKHCKPTAYDHNMHYVTRHNYTTHNAPMHCPMCAAHGEEYIRSRPFDYADTLTLKYPRVSRVFATRMIEEYNNLRTATRTRIQTTAAGNTHLSTMGVPCQYDCVEDMIVDTFPKLVTSTGICPLHVSCQDCLATFTILRTNPTAHDMPKYCIWCSSQHITVTLPSTDDTATLVLNLDLIESTTIANLAVQYDIPVTLMQALYEEWNKQAHVRTIADWMLTDSVQHIISLVHAKQAQRTVAQ